jgi:ribosomal protein L23
MKSSMALFGSKKKETTKKTVEKTAPASDVKKDTVKKKDTPKKDTKKDAAKKTAPTKKNLAPVAITLVPVQTEKSSLLQAQHKYTFYVTGTGVNKIRLKAAFEQQYGITPLSVRVVKQQPKRRGYVFKYGLTKRKPKAIFTLPADKSISI